MGQAEIAQVVRQEIETGNYPFPQPLIEALIRVESNWKPGIVNPNSGASGLMQLMPITLRDYNLHNWPKLTMDDLQGVSLASIRSQVKTGLWALGTFWRGAYAYLQPKLGTVPLDELVKIADLFYVAGPSATKKKLATLDTPTFEKVSTTYPDWNALPHPNKVWTYTIAEDPVWDLEAIDSWVRKGSQPIVAGFDGHLGGYILGALALIFVWYFFGKKKAKSEE